MDLEKPTTILRRLKDASSATPPETSFQMSLFEAVRKWTDSEDTDAFDIELDGRRLTPEQIEEISRSETFKQRLLAFDQRL